MRREAKVVLGRLARLCLSTLIMIVCTYGHAPAFTLNVVDGNTGLPIAGGFRYLVEEDNTNLTVPGALVADSISLDIHNSHAPVVTEGTSGSFSASVNIPNDKRYFVSILPDVNFALSGAPVAVGQNTVTVSVNPHPLPTSQITVFAHVDHNPINNTWDEHDGGLTADAILNGGLGGVNIMISDAAGMVTQDAFGNPLGTTYVGDGFGGFALVDGEPVVDQLGNGSITTLTKTDFDAGNNPYGLNVGEAVIKFITPGKYGITVIPPHTDDSGNPVEWIQTSTIEGTPVIDAWVKANEPTLFVEGFGTGFNHASFGFVKISPTSASTINGQTVNVAPWNIASGEPGYIDRSGYDGYIDGTLRLNHFSRPPALQGFFAGPPVEDCWVGLNDPVVTPGVQPAGLYTAPCDPATGYFRIDNVPPGTYQLVNWETPLDFLFGFRTVTVPATGEAVNLGDILVFRWFGNLEGKVFLDANQNGFPDDGDSGLPLQDLALRFRDGTIYQATTTDLSGEYSFPEVFPFFKWLVAETGFATLKDTGYTNAVDQGGAIPADAGWTTPSRGKLNPQPQTSDGTFAGPPLINPNTGNNLSRTEVSGSPGETLLQAMHLFLGQTNVIDWGKAPYGPGLDGIHGTVDDENGGIAGIVYYAVTRAENDPRFAAGEEWEPGIPRVQVNVYRDSNADGVIDAPGILADIDNHPLGWNVDPGAKGPEDIDRNDDGNFDWGAAVDITWTDSWDDNKPSGCMQDLPTIHGTTINECADAFGTWNQIRPGVFDGGYAIGDLTTDTYIVESAVPPGYVLMKEEDKNVDFGEPWTPSPLNLPPVCVGDLHTVPAELTLFPDIEAPYAGQSRPLCDRKQIYVTGGKNADLNFWLFTEVPKAARAVGFVNNDLGAEFNMASPNFGEKIAPSFLPISLQDWTGKEISRIYTDEFGGYNALLPSTYTVNTPSPTGVTPSMMTLVLNEPLLPDGTIDPYHDPTFTVTTWTFNFNPGATSYLDTPIIPNAAFAASDIQIDTQPADASPVIDAVNGNGPAGGPLFCTDLSGTTITLTSAGLTTIRNPAYDPGVPGSPVTITRDFGFGGTEGSVSLDGVPLTIESWTEGTIVATIPGGASSGTLLVTRGDTGATTQVGVTLNIENCATTTVLNVPSPQYGTIQSAIDAAGAGDLILVAAGTYNENVIMYKPVRLQGAGAGGTIISANPSPIDRLQAWHTRVDALGARDFASFLLKDPFSASEAPGIFVIGELDYPLGNLQNPLPGTTTLNPGNPFSAGQAMIDGFTILGSKAGSGIFAVAGAEGLIISNNEITTNSGNYAGGIAIGTPDVGFDQQNPNIVIRDNKLHRNGGIQGAGGIAMNEGSHNYLVENNLVHGNLGRFNGGGIAHRGLSLGENIIRGNRILFNEVFFGALLNLAGDGGGIFVGDDVAGSTGTGNVTIDGNLIQGNMSGSGNGGGIRAFAVNATDVFNSPNNAGGWYQLKIVNNMIVNNIAALSGAGISLQDVARAEIINNTIANNDSTATGAFAFEAGAANSTPQPSGIVAGEHSAILQGFFGAGLLQTYSNPVLENNILWHNRSFFNDASLNAGAGGLAANPDGLYWDLGVIDTVGTPPALNPDYSILSSLIGPDGKNYDDGFNMEFDPAFVLGYSNSLESATVIDEGGNAINVRFTPLDQNAGDYHITSGSPAVDGGTDVTAPELATDYDGDTRPLGCGVDIGADEVSAIASATLVSDPASPRPVGTLVDFTAGGAEALCGGSYEYRFWLNSGDVWTSVQDYSTDNTWTWDTSTFAEGNYAVVVYVRSDGSAAWSEAETGINYVLAPAAATDVTLAPDLASPQPAGITEVIFTAEGFGGSGPYEYRFWLNSGGVWTMVRDYSTTDFWTWNTSTLAGGNYAVVVYARSVGSAAWSEAETGIGYVLEAPAATGVTLVPDATSPQPVGTPQVIFTAEGSGGGTSYEYRFWLNSGGVWTMVQDYSTTATWTWNTSVFPAGSYTVVVYARSVGSTAWSEAETGIGYVLAAPAATGVTLVPDFASPQPVGTPQVVFTAGGTGGSGSYEYRFWLNSGGIWTSVQDYSTDNTWTWDTSALAEGNYVVVVYARSVGSTAWSEAETVFGYVISP